MHCWSSILSLVASNNIPDTMTSLFFVSIIWKKNTHPETWCFFYYLRPWPLFYSEFVTRKKTKKNTAGMSSASTQASSQVQKPSLAKLLKCLGRQHEQWSIESHIRFSSLTRTCSVHSSWIEKNWLLITVIVYRSIVVLTSCIYEKMWCFLRIPSASTYHRSFAQLSFFNVWSKDGWPKSRDVSPSESYR